jgi:hypothetical protein
MTEKKKRRIDEQQENRMDYKDNWNNGASTDR